MKKMKLIPVGLLLIITSTVSMADLPPTRDLATVCAQFPNQLPNQHCFLTDDILANTHYRVANNIHHPGNKETNYYLSSEYKRTIEGIVLSVHHVPAGVSYNCSDPREGRRLCDYMSGWIDTKGMWSTQGISHGYIEVVATMPVANKSNNEYFRGLWPAFWMMPTDLGAGWPTHGEIDVVEMHSLNPLQALTTLHYGNVVSVSDYLDNTFSSNSFYNNVSQINNYSQYHVFGLEWNFDADNPYLATWYDGRAVITRKLNVNDVRKGYSIIKDVFRPGQEKGYYLILNIATGGNFGPTSSQTSNGSGADAKNPLLEMKVHSIKSYKLQ